jgi:hypothetical protein
MNISIGISSMCLISDKNLCNFLGDTDLTTSWKYSYNSGIKSCNTVGINDFYFSKSPFNNYFLTLV